ncbi:hypothetical protein RND71_034380 [Anisodus tanguticus]|uniref:BRX domain-containing protein n=1 Tax=Anisodus tanguticus TaxID=243964 RepID=A0AAE1V2I7_9SOLA|nr:hypothetical protein RND71_034380 [Anisodus tanguticus]
MQAATWFLGLRAVISRSRHGLVDQMKSKRGVQSCISNPVGYMRRKHNLGLSVKKADFLSLSGSPNQSFSEKYFSDGLSRSSDFFLPQSCLSCVHNEMDNAITNSSSLEPDYLRLLGKYVLKDVFIWGEGAEGGCFGHGEVKLYALLPKFLESTTMLYVQTTSIGRSHAALVTKQGEVFCWGEGKNGRLGYKFVMATTCKKIVDSLNGVHVKFVSCGESKKWLDPIESLLDVFPSRGQVPCLEFLGRGRGHHTRTQNSQASAVPTHLKVFPEPTALIIQEKLSESNKFLLEEVSKLRTQVERALHIVNLGLVNQLFVAQYTKPWLACFAYLQLQTMSESLYYARREAKNEAVHVDVQDRKVDRLLASPIVFSKKLRSLYNNKQNYADDLEVEWVEEYQPGVFITLTMSPTGNKKIKRVKLR